MVEETTGPPGAADPEHVVFRQQRGFRRAVALDTATAGILGACDGELTLGQIVDSVAGLLERRAADLLPARQLRGSGRWWWTGSCAEARPRELIPKRRRVPVVACGRVAVE